MNSGEDEGLNAVVLMALRSSRYERRDLLARIERHLEENDGYVAFSGGKDSTVVVDLAREVDPNVPVLWFDSGAEFDETYEYVEMIADRWSLNLTVHRCDPSLLTALVSTGVWDHHNREEVTVVDLHDLLIGAPSALAHSDHGPGELWGVRSRESAGRRAMYARELAREVRAGCDGRHHCSDIRERRLRHGGVVRRVDGTVAYGPIWNWSTQDVWGYFARHGIPVNPVYRILQELGAPEHAQRVSAIVDGAMLEQGRITWLRRGWPHLFEQYAAVLPRLREFV